MDIGKLPAQRRDYILCLFQAQRGLGGKGHALGIGDGQLLDFLRAADHLGDGGSFAQGADHLIMITVADEDDAVIIFGEAHCFHVYLGHQRTGGVNHPQAAPFARLPHLRRDPVGAVDNPFALGNLFHVVNENRALAL